MDKTPKKNLDITEDEICKFLGEVKKLIKRNSFKISDKNREKNVKFIEDYNLNMKKQKDMLLNLTEKDFCYVADDYKTQEKLYIFSKDYKLSNWGILENVSVYIKIVLKELSNIKFCLVVSFHKREKNINYMFE